MALPWNGWKVSSQNLGVVSDRMYAYSPRHYDTNTKTQTTRTICPAAFRALDCQPGPHTFSGIGALAAIVHNTIIDSQQVQVVSVDGSVEFPRGGPRVSEDTVCSPLQLIPEPLDGHGRAVVEVAEFSKLGAPLIWFLHFHPSSTMKVLFPSVAEMSGWGCGSSI